MRIDCLKTLGSGLTVVYDDVPSVGTTALAFFVAVGSRDESPEDFGSAHLLEHLLFKGAGDWDYRAIAREMDHLGADVNAFTTRDYTCFYARVLDASAPRAYRLLATLVTRPWISASDLMREKSVVVEEIRESQDDADDVLDRLLTEASYQDPQYTHDILGTIKTLQGIHSDSLAAFFNRFYRPSNMVFAVSGGACDAVLQLVSLDFSKGAADSQLPHQRSQPHWRATERTLSTPWEQVHWGMAVPAPARYDSGYAAALVTASILAGQNSSRLWQRLREEEGLVYTVSAQYGPEEAFGDLSVYLSLGQGNMDRAARALWDELNQLIDKGPNGDELERTRASLYTMLVMGQETPDQRVMRLGRAGLDRRLAPNLATLKSQLEEVGSEAVRQCAQKFRMPGELATALAGPLRKPEDAIRHLVRGRSIKHV